jgi:hypothetical protein
MEAAAFVTAIERTGLECWQIVHSGLNTYQHEHAFISKISVPISLLQSSVIAAISEIALDSFLSVYLYFLGCAGS